MQSRYSKIFLQSISVNNELEDDDGVNETEHKSEGESDREGYKTIKSPLNGSIPKGNTFKRC